MFWKMAFIRKNMSYKLLVQMKEVLSICKWFAKYK